MTGAVLAALLWRIVAGVPTLPEIVGDHLVTLIPGTFFEVGIQTLGPLAKKILFVLIMIGQILIGGGLAVVLSRLSDGAPDSIERTGRSFARAIIGALLVGGALIALIAGANAVEMGLGILALVSVVYGAVLAAIDRQTARPLVKQGAGPAKPVWYVGSPGLNRRGVLILAVGAATAATATALARGAAGRSVASSAQPTQGTTVPSVSTSEESAAAQPNPAVSPTPIPTVVADSTATSSPATSAPTAAAVSATPANEIAIPMPTGAVPAITPAADFYKVSKNFLADPRPDGNQWRLSVEGMVNQPTVFTLADIRALPSVAKQHTLTCISNEVGGDLIGNANWKGVRLADVLKQVGIKDGVRKVVLTGADGYQDSILLERALNPGAVLAYEMDGAPLPPEHGFPLRLLVPNIYGMKNLKWITKIELVNTDFQGYWQRGGWSDPAPIKTMSRIDVAKGSGVGQPVSIAGIAFAGERGVGAVQVSADGGKTWQTAEVERPNLPNVWSRWVTRWIPQASGTFQILVRAVDGKGEVQTSNSAAPFPDGASGWHSVGVQVG
jgi:DMSO/TMAO reductase YedYZ molybdopterin-dependent catalytic subunit